MSRESKISHRLISWLSISYVCTTRFRKLWQTDQPSNRRTDLVIWKLHFPYKRLISPPVCHSKVANPNLYHIQSVCQSVLQQVCLASISCVSILKLGCLSILKSFCLSIDPPVSLSILNIVCQCIFLLVCRSNPHSLSFHTSVCHSVYTPVSQTVCLLFSNNSVCLLSICLQTVCRSISPLHMSASIPLLSICLPVYLSSSSVCLSVCLIRSGKVLMKSPPWILG